MLKVCIKYCFTHWFTSEYDIKSDCSNVKKGMWSLSLPVMCFLSGTSLFPHVDKLMGFILLLYVLLSYTVLIVN